MKLKKLAALFSAAALAVTSLSVGAFAEVETIAIFSCDNLNYSFDADGTMGDKIVFTEDFSSLGDDTTISVSFSSLDYTDEKSTVKINGTELKESEESPLDKNVKEIVVEATNCTLMSIMITKSGGGNGGSSPRYIYATFNENGKIISKSIQNTVIMMGSKSIKVGDTVKVTFDKPSPNAVVKVNDKPATLADDNTYATVTVGSDWKGLEGPDQELSFSGSNYTAVKVDVTRESDSDNQGGGNQGGGNQGGDKPADPDKPAPSAPSGGSSATTTQAPDVVTGANGESVEAPKDVIPEGATLEVKEQTTEDAVKAVEAVKATDENKEVVETVKKAVEDGKAVVADISLTKDGAEVQPNGTIKVTVKIPAALKDATKLYVYRVEADGTFTDVKAEIVNRKIVFTTSHFSTYIISLNPLSGDAVVTEGDEAAETSATEAPVTEAPTTEAPAKENSEDKNQATGVAIAIIPAVLAAAGVVISKKRK